MKLLALLICTKVSRPETKKPEPKTGVRFGVQSRGLESQSNVSVMNSFPFHSLVLAKVRLSEKAGIFSDSFRSYWILSTWFVLVEQPAYRPMFSKLPLCL